MARILIIDDEPEARAAVARRLRRAGYEVEEAAGEHEGVERIRSNPAPFDLVITDMVMEDPDSGIRTLEAALARDMFSEVIVLTAYGKIVQAVECMRRGAFDYVEKNIPDVDVYELLVLRAGAALDRRLSSLQALRRYQEIGQREGIALVE